MIYTVGCEVTSGMRGYPEIVREALRMHAKREGLVIEDDAEITYFKRTDHLAVPPTTRLCAEVQARKAD